MNKKASLSDLLDAWEGYEGEVDFFIEAWTSYLSGEDTPCPETPSGLHEVTDGSCDQCGSKNRETPTLPQKTWHIERDDPFWMAVSSHGDKAVFYTDDDAVDYINNRVVKDGDRWAE